MSDLTPTISFSSSLPIQVHIRPRGEAGADWREFDWGPGFFNIPAGNEISVRIRTIDDAVLAQLLEEIGSCKDIIALNLSENRRITNKGIGMLRAMPQLTWLNISSCDIDNDAVDLLAAGLPRLQHLNMSFCNRLNDLGAKKINKLNKLTFLDLQGCIKITKAGVTKVERRGLTIHSAK